MYNDVQQNSILKGYNMLLFFAGTMILYEPSEECITDFWTKGILMHLPVSSTNPNFIKASMQLSESCDPAKFCSRTLNEDYNRLFSEKNKPLAPIYESKNKDFTFSSTSYQVENVSYFYESYGWVSKFKNIVSDDHLSVELPFLTRLIENYAGLEDHACREEMRKEIRRYMETHLFSWINEWNRKVQSHSTTISYKGIGNLIIASLEDIYSILGEKYEFAFSINNLKN